MSSSSTYNLERLSVMCVDDNRDAHPILKALLNAMKITDVRFCVDTVEAYVQMERVRPDILLVDFEMRPLGGLGFVKLLRRDPESPAPEVPVLVTTGHKDESRLAAAREAGAHGIVPKPVTARGLYESLAAVIDSPLPIIKSQSYIGPCRRHRSLRVPEKRDQTDGVIDMNEFPANELEIARAG